MKTAPLMLLLAAFPCTAAFPASQQSVKLAYGQKSATVMFETDGSAITRTKALCDCTKLKAQGSKLTAVVDTSKFDTTVDKQIDATTADGKTTRLTIHFEVPPALILSSRSLVWALGSAPEPQELTITLPAGSPVTDILDAGLSGDAFDYAPETLTKGRNYRVRVSPKSTAKKVLNRLVLKTASSDPRFAQQIIYLQVR